MSGIALEPAQVEVQKMCQILFLQKIAGKGDFGLTLAG